MLSESTEMYLITIYRLTSKKDCYAHTKDIAEGMNVSLPSVSEQLKKLSERGYVNYEWRKGANLTKEGENIALAVLRKHRLIEAYLVKMAGYSIDEVHEEACRLEHVVSDRLADHFDKVMDYPLTDPHGHPIPDKSGKFVKTKSYPLSSFQSGESVLINQVSDWDKTQLSYLLKIGLVPDTKIKIVDVAPFDGPLTLELHDKTIALSREIADNILVTPDQDS